MSLVQAIYNRRIDLILSKCKDITPNVNLVRKFNNNIKISSINRLYKYIIIQNDNYEIYGINNNKLVDYHVSLNNEIDSKYIEYINTILHYTNLYECECHIFDTNNLNTSIKNISRSMSKTETGKRKRNSDDDLLESLIKKKFNYNIDEQWVSASKTRNSALNDRCLDYYNEYNITNYDDNPTKLKPYYLTSDKRPRKDSFNEFLNIKFQEGNEFEERVIKYLEEKYTNNIIKIGESYMARDKEMCIKTFKAMYKGIPLIYQAVLQNPENKTLGSVDLLVRDDFINEITNKTYEIDKFKSIFPHNHFYYAIDIKNSKLQFNVDNVTLRNNLHVKPFKFQLHVYNEALKYMQDLKTTKAFIMGKGWKMDKTVNKQKITEESYQFNDKLGIIDFSTKDDYICMETEDAINWLQDLKASTDWTHKPPTNINIYPNMCNTSDEGYRHIKQKSAEELKDLTLVSYLTPEHRMRAFKAGIKTWDDPKLNSSIIGLNGKIGEYVDAILNTNRDKSDKVIFFKSLDPTPQNIFDTSKLEYYIDFETIIQNNKNYVYMIGLGYGFNNEWKYNCFTLDKLDEESERKMYDQLLSYIEEINKKYNITYKPLYYHWSSVEPNQMNKMIDNLKLSNNNIEWFDLYKYFKENMITVKGAFNHSLKSIGKGMYKNKLIDTYWNSDILGDNKINSIAYNKYFKNINTGFDDLIKYNEVDCKIMYDILNVVRKMKV